MSRAADLAALIVDINTTEAKTDELTGKSTAGSIAVTAEGNSTTTNLQQGLCKVWVHYNGDSSHAVQDSFNITSVTDGGTGRGTVSIANDMANDDYSLQYTDSCPDSPAINGLYIHTFQTGAYSLASVNNSGGYTDGTNVCSAVFGDLA